MGFRVRSSIAKRSSTGTHLKNYKLRKQVDRLSVPKMDYVPKDPY